MRLFSGSGLKPKLRSWKRFYPTQTLELDLKSFGSDCDSKHLKSFEPFLPAHGYLI